MNWPVTGLEDDMRPRMFALARDARPFALATIVAADGGPRPVGAQMVIAEEGQWGFLSGGCIEDDVALHARAVIAGGEARHLVYGRGSPFIDMRLPCGGRIEVLVERVLPDDPALTELERLATERTPALWRSDGTLRSCRLATEMATTTGEEPADIAGGHARLFLPPQRLIVIGSDPFALAIAALGRQMGWEVLLAAPGGPAAPAPFDLVCDRRPLPEVMGQAGLDRWTALALATHDVELDHGVLAAALRSEAHYVGALGSRTRLADRLDLLREAGLPEDRIARLRAPIGLDLGARSPWEIGIAVIAEIIANAAANRMPGG